MKKAKLVVLALLSAIVLSEVATVTASACDWYPPHSYEGAMCRYNKGKKKP